MKRCPECRRDYVDDNLLYCLEDGAALVQGSVPGPEEPQTAILSGPQVLAAASGAYEATTRLRSNTTDQTAVLSSAFAKTSPSTGFDKRLLVAALALLAVVAGGFFAFRYLRSSGAAPISSIAVLPFENRSSDADTDYLSDGLAESLIFRLTQLSDLKVSPSSSVTRYKGKDTDVAKIASELGVDAVMTGRMTKRGDDLNIAVELVDARVNRSLWGEQYQRKMSELLTTQREIAASIAEKLQLKLTGDTRKGVTKKYTDNNEAYQLYLKGRFHFAKRAKDDFLQAADLYQQAIKLDPNFAMAYVGLADVYNLMPTNSAMPPKESFPQAKAAAEKALAIDPSLSEAHAALANTLSLYEWNWKQADSEYKKAIELNPNVADNHYYYGLSNLYPTGRLDEGIREIQTGLQLEPLSVPMGANIVQLYLAAGQAKLALEQAQKTHALDPNHRQAVGMLIYAFLENRMYAEAIALSEKTLQSNPSNQTVLCQAGIGYARIGKPQKAEEMIARLREIAKTEYVQHTWIAYIYTALGDKDQAFAELEQAFQERESQLWSLKVVWLLAPLRDDPRYKDLLTRMDLAG